MIKKCWIICFLFLATSSGGIAFAAQFVGVTDFAKRFNLTFSDPGVIDTVHIERGQIVSKGQPLISLDSRILAAKVAKSEAVLSAYEPLLKQKITELEKANELYDRDSLARVDLENAEHQHKIARANFDAAQADVDITKLQLQRAQLVAPISGMVVGLNANPGEVINNASFYRVLVALTDHRKMVAITHVGSEIWHQNLSNKFAKVIYRDKAYSGAVIYVGQERTEKASGIPGFEVRVLFSTKGDIPANMPVTIELQE